MKKVSDSLKQQLYMLLNSFGNFNMLIEEGGIKQLSTAIEDKLDVIIFNSLIEKGMASEDLTHVSTFINCLHSSYQAACLHTCMLQYTLLHI